jgi:DNA invertase Pin-like site-specific DNA recombinase
MDRPGWMKLMQKVEKKQVTDIYMEEISRMGRTREDGFKEWMRLNELGIHLHFTRQPQVNTDTYRKSVEQDVRINLSSADNATKELMNAIIEGINKYRKEVAKQQIYNVFDEAQYERDILAKRTSEGLMVAKLNGKRVGRQKGEKIITQKQIKAKKKILKLYKKYGGPLSATDCIKVCGVSRDSFYKYVKQLDKEACLS